MRWKRDSQLLSPCNTDWILLEVFFIEPPTHVAPVLVEPIVVAPIYALSAPSIADMQT